MIENRELFYDESYNKELRITVYHEGQEMILTNSDIYEESLSLTESICSNPSEVEFGACQASELSFTLGTYIPYSLKGDKIKVELGLVKDDYKGFMQLGIYTVESDRPDSERNYREIVAYDALYTLLNADVAGWYNELTFPTQAATMLGSLLNHFNIPLNVSTFAGIPNITTTIYRSIYADRISGADMLRYLCQLFACFGRIGRNGAFELVSLDAITIGLYPSVELYPADDLYPVGEAGVVVPKAQYISADYEDYQTAVIDKLVIRQEEGDIGVVVGSGSNTYTIEGNLLLANMSAPTLQTIASGIYDKLRYISYRPVSCVAVGNPFIQTGDIYTIYSGKEVLRSYVLTRTLSGIQALRDTYEAFGDEFREQSNQSVSQKVMQLSTKTAKIVQTVDEVSTELSDLSADTTSKISQLSGAISAKVTVGQSYNGMVINGDGIKCTGTGSFIVDMNNFSVDADGNVTINGKLQNRDTSGGELSIESGAITQKQSYSSGTLSTLTIAQSNIWISKNQNVLFHVDDSGNMDALGACRFGSVNTGNISAENLTVSGTITGTVSNAGTANYAASAGYAGRLGSDANYATCDSQGRIHCSNVDGTNFTTTGSGSDAIIYTTSTGNYIRSAASSSRRYKHDISANIREELDPHKLYDIPVVEYMYNDGYLPDDDPHAGDAYIGFIAEEVEEIYPLAVNYKDGQPEMWNYRVLLPAMMKLIQEQHSEIEQLKTILKEKGVI